MLKVIKKNTRTTSMTSTPFSSVFIVDFEQVNVNLHHDLFLDILTPFSSLKIDFLAPGFVVTLQVTNLWLRLQNIQRGCCEFDFPNSCDKLTHYSPMLLFYTP